MFQLLHSLEATPPRETDHDPALAESLELIVSAQEVISSLPFRKNISYNRGTHLIHTGGERASYLLLPFVPRGDS